VNQRLCGRIEKGALPSRALIKNQILGNDMFLQQLRQLVEATLDWDDSRLWQNAGNNTGLPGNPNAALRKKRILWKYRFS
jgi:hypothetical protein